MRTYILFSVILSICILPSISFAEQADAMCKSKIERAQKACGMPVSSKFWKCMSSKSRSAPSKCKRFFAAYESKIKPYSDQFENDLNTAIAEPEKSPSKSPRTQRSNRNRTSKRRFHRFNRKKTQAQTQERAPRPRNEFDFEETIRKRRALNKK